MPAPATFLAGGQMTTVRHIKSADGITWATHNPSGVSGTTRDFAWSSTLGLWVRAGGSGCHTSIDATTWTARTVPTGSNQLLCSIWVPELAKFFMGDSFDGKINNSSDGITWGSGTFTGATSINDLEYSPSLSLLVAVGLNGKLATSPTGTTWTSRTSGFGADAIEGVAWSPSLALFVAVGAAGKLFTSTDGITWTTRTSGFGADNINTVVWSPSLALFVIAGNSGKLSTSPDGITWTARTSGFSTTSIWKAEWAASLGMFVIVGSQGKVATSTNGTAWTVRTSNYPSSDAIYTVRWGPEYVPPTPTTIKPLAAATVTTDIPTLEAVLPVAGASGRTVKGIWDLATDAGFTSNLKTITESDGDFRVSGNTTEPVPPHLQLMQGTWFIRARSKSNYDELSAWSASQSFTVSHPPSATPSSPQGGFTYNWQPSGDRTFSWTFSDSSPVDSQTAYQIIVEVNSSGASVLDTGKVTGTVNFTTLNIGAAHKDTTLRWKIRVWDTDDVAGSYSAYALFIVGDPPVVSVTAPAEAGIADNPQPTVSWNFTGSGGRTQVSRRVYFTRTSDGVIVHDTTILPSTQQSYTPPGPVLERNVAYTVTVYVIDSQGLVGEDTNAFTTAWTPPAAPSGVVINAATHATLGYVTVQWDDTVRDADFFAWRVYRRETLNPSTTVVMLMEDTNTARDEYKDWMAASQIAYEYKVVQVANRFGALMESEA